VTEVRDLVLHPPNDTPYNVLKETLIKRTAALEQQRLQQLFSTEELGDRKPTQLLRHLHQLLGDNTALKDTFLKKLFLQRLPANVRMVLASSPANMPFRVWLTWLTESLRLQLLQWLPLLPRYLHHYKWPQSTLRHSPPSSSSNS